MRATVVAEKEKVRKQRAARRAATAAPRLDRVKRRSERVQGQPAPIYDERVLLRDDREPSMKREKSDRRLLKGMFRKNKALRVNILGSILPTPTF